MSTHKKCGCTNGSTGDVSRRQILQAGLAAAATVTAGTPGDLLAQNQAESKSRNKQALRANGARAIDIHAHYYPQSFLDLIAEEGKSPSRPSL
jgi:aminocarboxymuconate-semialdehyde decarboxylase